jgi:cytochrome b561
MLAYSIAFVMFELQILLHWTSQLLSFLLFFTSSLLQAFPSLRCSSLK